MALGVGGIRWQGTNALHRETDEGAVGQRFTTSVSTRVGQA